MTVNKEIESLQEHYEKVCNDYVFLFCLKQGMVFDGWVSDLVGSIAFCDDYFFAFSDIVWDVNSSQPKGTITDWYHENMELPEKSINYFSYTKGLRISDIE